MAKPRQGRRLRADQLHRPGFRGRASGREVQAPGPRHHRQRLLGGRLLGSGPRALRGEGGLRQAEAGLEEAEAALAAVGPDRRNAGTVLRREDLVWVAPRGAAAGPGAKITVARIIAPGGMATCAIAETRGQDA